MHELLIITKLVDNTSNALKITGLGQRNHWISGFSKWISV